MKKLGHGDDANYVTLAACNARDNDSDSSHLQHAGVNAVVNLRPKQ